MAGSYRHIVDKDNNLLSSDSNNLDNLGDAYEALEECYDMIQYLTGGDKRGIYIAWAQGYLKKRLPAIEAFPTEQHFWRE